MSEKKSNTGSGGLYKAASFFAIALFLGVCLSSIITYANHLMLQQENPPQTAPTAFVWLVCMAASLLFMSVLYAVTEPGEVKLFSDRKFLISFSFVLTMLAMFIAYFYVGMSPSAVSGGAEESKNVFMIDGAQQYAPFLSGLLNIMKGNGSFLYSFSDGLGAGFLPLFANYCASPFNILLLLFPFSAFEEAVMVITVLKIATGAAGFAGMVTYIYKRHDLSVPVIAMMYGLMSWFLVQSWNIMWLDAVYMLPFVAWGLHKLMREGKFTMYAITLGMAILVNYYIGFMICIFMILYFVAVAFSTETIKIENLISRVTKFVIGSALGGGFSAMLLLPTIIALSNSSATNDTFSRDITSNFNMLELFGRELFAVSPSIRGDALPNIYCGILALVLIPLFLMSKKINLRRKILFASLAGIMAFSFSLNILNYFWHGMHFTNDIPYRYSFLFSFALLIMAYEALIHIHEFTHKQIIPAVAVVVGLVFIFETTSSETGSFQTVYLSAFLMILYGIIMYATSKNKDKINHTMAIVLLLVAVELTSNACITIKQMGTQETYFAKNCDFVRQYPDVKNVLGSIKESDPTLYRMDVAKGYNINRPFWYHYKGVNTFSSTNNLNVTKMMKGFGFASNGINSYMHNAFVPAIDSLLGMKYFVYDQAIVGYPQLQYLDGLSQVDGYFVHENTMAAPLGFVVKPEITGLDVLAEKNPFKVQSQIYELGFGINDVYSFAYGMSPNYNHDPNNPTYFLIDLDDRSSDTFTVTPEKTAQHYIYVDCRDCTSINVNCGESQTYNVVKHEPYTIDLGVIGPETPIEVTIDTDQTVGGNIFVAALNNDSLGKAIDQARASGLVVEKYSDTKIKGTMESEQGGRFFTSIPYDKGWKVKVDGKPVLIKPLSGLISFDIAPGAHSIEFTFFPPGLLLGIAITLLSVALIALLWVLKSDKIATPADGILKASLFFEEDMSAHSGSETGGEASEKSEQVISDEIVKKGGKFRCPYCKTDIMPILKEKAEQDSISMAQTVGIRVELVDRATFINGYLNETGATCSCGKDLKPCSKK